MIILWHRQQRGRCSACSERLTAQFGRNDAVRNAKSGNPGCPENKYIFWAPVCAQTAISMYLIRDYSKKKENTEVIISINKSVFIFCYMHMYEAIVVTFVGIMWLIDFKSV